MSGAVKAALAGCILTVLLLPAVAAVAGEIFISPAGDDSAGGTRQSPLKTVAAAVAKAAEGDTITLRQGTYAGGVNLNKRRLTLQGAKGEAARLELPAKEPATYAVVAVTAGGVTLRNLELVGGAMHAVDFRAADGLLEDCRCHDTGADVLKCSPSSSNVVIRRCEIFNSGKNGGWFNNAEGIDNVRSDNMLVQDCFIHDIATNGCYAKGGARNALIERCLFVRIGLSRDVQGQGAVLGESAGGTKDYESIDGIVRNCMFIDISGAGVAAWGALRPKFYNNTCVNVAKSDRAGFIILAAGSTGKPSKDVTFINNIVWCSDKGKRALVWIYDKGHEGTLTLANNIYFGGSGQFIRAGKYLTGLKAWQEATGADAGSSLDDPKLDEIFHLTKDSPCVGKGRKLPGVTDDYDGGKRTGEIDIGADQADAGPAVRIPPAAGAVGTGLAQAASQPAQRQ